jgi:hypothetical protein
MQTFLPHKNFRESAQALDSRRLNKQLLEGRQIYSILVLDRQSGGWVRHPAVLMWKGYENVLFQYLSALRDECEARNIRWQKNWEEILRLHDINQDRILDDDEEEQQYPQWINDERIYESHRFNLFRKDPEYYIEFADSKNFPCCIECNYFWPSHNADYRR